MLRSLVLPWLWISRANIIAPLVSPASRATWLSAGDADADADADASLFWIG
ncbi:hypothetical protein [Comamonas sp.]|uniref:hypothetical protein n=1 Tax=Comamonas sp. TaxID=34028 RepID=UPI002582CB22|nr:hypothetical protein [Comamonas sp.]